MNIKTILLILLVSMSLNVYAVDPATRQEVAKGPPSEDAMVFDGLILRPLYFVRTLVGTGIFIATLPFSGTGETQEQAKQRLIDEPADKTFNSCLGCLVENRH